MALSDKQRGVVRGMLVAVAVTLVVLGGALVLHPVVLPPGTTDGGRIAFALKMDSVIAFWLVLSIGRLARHRFFTPEDIDGGGLCPGTDKAHVLQAVLQNSLEQTVLAVLAHLAWVVIMPISAIAAIPAAVFLFLCGRVLFVQGYAAGAPSRALGFGLTFYPSVLMLLVAFGVALVNPLA